MRQIFIFIFYLQINGQQLDESLLHFVTVSKGEVTKDEIEAGLEIWFLLHDVLK
jgi:hypothetical protein